MCVDSNSERSRDPGDFTTALDHKKYCNCNGMVDRVSKLELDLWLELR